MPEFIMPSEGRCAGVRFVELDPFVQAYIEAMFFTNSGEPEDELTDKVFGDMSPQALDRIKEECALFKDANERLLRDAYSQAGSGYDERMAGHDFWYTRNGHGVGFWDRDLGETGESLSISARGFSNVDPYVGDDGKIYV